MARTWAATGLGVILAALTVYPWVGRGWVLVLDWARGPRTVASPSLFGFSLPPSPAAWALNGLQLLVGGQQVTWILIAVSFPIACVSIARLVPTRPAAACAGGALYAVNPIVYERLAAGQVLFVLGYALLPAAVSSFHAALQRPRPDAAGPALWVLGLSLVSIHFVWICSLAALAIAVGHRRRPTLVWLLKLLPAVILMEAYALIPLAAGRSSGVSVGPSDLQLFRTASDPVFGLYTNALSLYGFWRDGVPLPKDVDVLWPAIMALLLVMAAHGLRSARQPSEKALLTGLGLGAVAGYFLALGEQGPTAGLYSLLYSHLPGFNVMREAQKFDVLVVLFLSVGLAYGADDLLRRLGSRTPLAAVAAVFGVALPLAYTPTMFGGLDGHVSAYSYPRQWSGADAVMGYGPGRILFLPWHEYLEFPFTRGEVIANPAGVFFRRTVISGDNVEVGDTETESTSPRSAYLEQLFHQGDHLTDFGHLVAQLGVSYVVLAHAVDFRSYAWLYEQGDLAVAYQSSSITVFRNEAPAVPEGSRVSSRTTASGVQGLIDLSRSPAFDATAVEEGARTGSVMGVARSRDNVRQTSPISYRIGAGPPGWVVLPEPFDPAWKVEGRSGSQLVNGMVAFPVGSSPAVASFRTWQYVKWGYIVSGASVAVGASATARHAYRRRTARLRKHRS